MRRDTSRLQDETMTSNLFHLAYGPPEEKEISNPNTLAEINKNSKIKRAITTNESIKNKKEFVTELSEDLDPTAYE